MNEFERMTEEEFLKQYKPGDYKRPSVSVDMLIFAIQHELKEPKLELLLVKRGNHPFKGHWAIPGGFVEIDESLADAAARELKEETGLEDIYMEQLYTFGAVKRDPRMRVISTTYMALLPKEQLNPVAGDDAADLAWFEIEADFDHKLLTLTNKEHDISIRYQYHYRYEKNGNIKVKYPEVQLEKDSKGSLAFDHGLILATALERLRNKVEYTQIAFNLVPEKFTLVELQKIYEVILGRKLIKAAFRRKMAPMVELTGEEKVVDGVIRNAKYYRLIEREED